MRCPFHLHPPLIKAESAASPFSLPLGEESHHQLTCQLVQYPPRLELGPKIQSHHSTLSLIILPGFAFLLFHFNYVLEKEPQIALALLSPVAIHKILCAKPSARLFCHFSCSIQLPYLIGGSSGEKEVLWMR